MTEDAAVASDTERLASAFEGCRGVASSFLDHYTIKVGSNGLLRDDELRHKTGLKIWIPKINLIDIKMSSR